MMHRHANAVRLLGLALIAVSAARLLFGKGDSALSWAVLVAGILVLASGIAARARNRR
jgi:hypothetical protein